MVSIAASQAVDPGSIPGRRRSYYFASKHAKVEKTDFLKSFKTTVKRKKSNKSGCFQ